MSMLFLGKKKIWMHAIYVNTDAFLGTFCTLDICISRLEDTGTVDIRGTVEKIRSQRAYSIQMPDQYFFCHVALVEYACSKGLLSVQNISVLSPSIEEDSD